MTEYITKGQAVDAAYRAIHYGFNDVHKVMMEGKDLKVNADNFYYTLLENVRAEIAVALPDDVVEVVRCEECYRTINACGVVYCKWFQAFVDPKGFCQRGKRGESNG